jgi:hypothetical protein
MSVAPSCDRFWMIMSTTTPSAASGENSRAATPGTSRTPRTRIFASLRL